MIKVRKYLLKVWNPEDYSLIAKKSLSSDDIEAIKKYPEIKIRSFSPVVIQIIKD